MIVLVITDCPPKLRGDVTKWLLEINTGVYVGNVNVRVRDALWKKVCDTLTTGRATMVFPAEGEQGLDFYIHNTNWRPTDFDGIKLIKRPLPKTTKTEVQSNIKHRSKTGKMVSSEMIRRARQKKQSEEEYVVIDIETTGLSIEDHYIIEIAAARVKDGRICDEFSSLINSDVEVSEEIETLTGIITDLLRSDGISEKTALKKFLEFISDSRIVAHNARFDLGFLQHACRFYNYSMINNPYIDTMMLARQKDIELENYKLKTIADYFSIEASGLHRALSDCRITFQIYEKLKET